MVNIYEDNGVTMNLGQYLDMRDEIKELRAFRDNLAEFVRDNRCSYNPAKRDLYDIGRKVLADFGLTETVEEVLTDA